MRLYTGRTFTGRPYGGVVASTRLGRSRSYGHACGAPVRPRSTAPVNVLLRQIPSIIGCLAGLALTALFGAMFLIALVGGH